MNPLSGTINIDAQGNVTGRLTEVAGPPVTPPPVVPPPVTPPPVVPPPATGTKLDRTKANLLQLLGEGSRGQWLALCYFDLGNGYIYKAPLQNWLAVTLPRFGAPWGGQLDYAHWTDKSYWPASVSYDPNMPEIARLRAMQAFANQGS